MVYSSFNVDFDVAATFFVLVVLIYIVLKYPKNSLRNQLFVGLAVSILCATVTDIFASVCIFYGNLLPHWLIIVANTLYFALGVLVPYLLVVYVGDCIIPSYGVKLPTRVHRVLFEVFLIALVMNCKYGFFFSIARGGEYVHGPAYIIVYVIPMIYVLYTGIIIPINYKWIGWKNAFFTESYVLISTTGQILQFVFFSETLITLYAASLALLIMFFSLETPDYQKLNDTLIQLEQANHAKDDFLAHMSHEIRTPINGILGLNEMILRKTKEEETRSYALDVKSATDTLYKLINDILDFSRIASGKMEIIMTEYETVGLLRDIRNMLFNKAEGKGLKFLYEISPDLPKTLLGDDIRIKQVLINLINNGIKYTKKGSICLRVWGEKQGESQLIHYEVRDTGVGIKEEEMSKVFEAFERVDKQNTREIEGAGLGMSITTNLLHLMDSEIELESEYGKGSTFSFAILQKVVDATPIGKQNWSQEIKQSNYEYQTKIYAPEARILFVDDNAINRKVFRGLLAGIGSKVTDLESGMECLKEIKEKKYDLIFLDHMMPQLDGIETLKRIQREEHFCKKTPVIALTANAVIGMREKYLEEGFDDFLSKPIIPEQLENMLVRWLPKELQKAVPDKGAQEVSVDEPSENVEDAMLKKELAQINQQSVESLPESAEIDWKIGLLHMPEVAMLREIAIDFYKNIDRELELLESLIPNLSEKECLDRYRIEVHALKSTAASIGAMQVSSFARSLEAAAKANNLGRVASLHPIFTETMYELKCVLKELVKDDTGLDKRIELSEITTILQQLQNSLKEREYDAADECMEKIKAYSYEPKTQQKIDQLDLCVMNLEAENGIAVILELIASLDE